MTARLRTVSIAVAGIALASGYLTLRRAYAAVTVTGDSMTPTYADGDRVLVRCGTRQVSREAVVVFRMPASLTAAGDEGLRWLVKRVVAVPGDRVPDEVRDVVREDDVVPPDRLVVRGDGTRSLDSREFGYVPFEDVLGVATRRLR